MSEKFTFFLKGPLSQWHGPLRDRVTRVVANDSKFQIDGIEYNCAEQWMMASKARLFGDEASLAAIMAATHPRVQKDLGRKVAGFVKETWEEVAREIVYQGNYAKFTQNPHLKEALLATAGTTLVEVNPKDAVWGIALSESDPERLSRDTWRGTNWLGEVLTRLRENLIAESA